MRSPELRLLETSQSVRVGRIGKLFVVRWTAEPTKGVLGELRRLVDAAVREEGAISYCGITDDETAALPNDLRNDMVRASVDLIRQVSEFHLVLSGTSASARLTRSFFRAMVVGVRGTGRVMGAELGDHTRKVDIHESVDAFLKKFGDRDGVSVPVLRRLLVDRGFVSASTPAPKD